MTAVDFAVDHAELLGQPVTVTDCNIGRATLNNFACLARGISVRFITWPKGDKDSLRRALRDCSEPRMEPVRECRATVTGVLNKDPVGYFLVFNASAIAWEN